jgi:hypothetical protein
MDYSIWMRFMVYICFGQTPISTRRFDNMKLFPFFRPSRRFHSARPTLRLERLEDRVLLAGNLLITGEVPGQYAYNLQEYTQQGALVGSQSIPQAPGATETEDARDLSVGPNGNVNIYDGTNTPSLATLSAATNTWSYQTLSGWSTVNNITYGGVAAYKNYVFASSMNTDNSGGLVRFNTTDGTAVPFGQGSNFIQVTLGLDGQLYGLETNDTVQVFNPDTLAPQRTFTLVNGPDGNNIRSIAVDASGNVLAASWNGYVASFDPKGNYTGSSVELKSPYGFVDNLINLALDTDGQVAVGGRHGEIFLTNESLTSVQTIQTQLQNVFVTFDHYIGTAPQTVTPTFESLAGPTITYGQPTVTLGGRISAGAAYPTGNVNITVNGVTEAAAINPADGSFSASFDTSKLGVAGSPYTITYSYPGANNIAAIQDTSKSLTVLPAVTTLSDLSSPTVVVGRPTVAVSGTVGSNSVLPVGQSVTVTLVGANGTVASGSGVIGSDGRFSVGLNIAALPVGSYTLQYKYAGDANFDASSGSGTLQITYAVTPLFDTSKPVHAGAALPIKLAVSDALGDDLASANLSVTAVSLVGPNGAIYTPQAKGHANPGNLFRHVGYGYLYNLNTAGLTAGTYTLFVKVGDDPVLHAVSFVIA